LASSAERPIHLGVIYVNQAVDLIYRLPMTILLLSRTGPLRQDFLGLQLLPTLVMAQSMIKKSPPATRPDSFAHENVSNRQ